MRSDPAAIPVEAHEATATGQTRTAIRRIAFLLCVGSSTTVDRRPSGFLPIGLPSAGAQAPGAPGIGRGQQTAAEIASSLYHFWDLRGHYREGRGRLRRVLADGRELSTWVRARALMGEATLGVVMGDLEEAAVACSRAVDLRRAAGSGAGVAHASQYLGFIALCAGELDEARPLLEEALRTASAAGAEREHGWAQFFLAVLAMAETRFDDATEHAGRAEVVVGPSGDPELLAWASSLRGAAAWGRGTRATPSGTSPPESGRSTTWAGGGA